MSRGSASERRTCLGPRRSRWQLAHPPSDIESRWDRRRLSGEAIMGLEAVFFVGALVLLIALIYGVLNYHYRYRGTERVGDQIVRQRYRENESVPDAKSRADAAPRPSAERLTEPNGREPDFSEDDIQREM